MATKKSDEKRRVILDTAYRLFRHQGFDNTSMSQINAQVGGSKATIYSYFPSKEELFVECMTDIADRYMEEVFALLDNRESDWTVRLHIFGESFLRIVSSAEVVAVQRLMIAEAARSGVGKLFFLKLRSMRHYVSAFLAECMEAGLLRPADAGLAAEQLRALLEAEIVEPLLLCVNEAPPDEKTVMAAAHRAIATFLRAYAPAEKPSINALANAPV